MVPMKKRTVFYISDGTGITTETLGHALMTQFDHVPIDTRMIPYVDSEKKALDVLRIIQETAQKDESRPIVFSTLVDPHIRGIIQNSGAFEIDFFAAFTKQLENELQTTSHLSVGQTHGVKNQAQYDHRIDAIHYSLNTDDGQDLEAYSQADLILVGLSRSGKTPTSLYLAIHYGLKVANYPITEEELNLETWPPILKANHDKLFGLKIEPLRLHQIRQERKPGSRYASLSQCQWENKRLEKLFLENQITYYDTTHHSIEEIASTILMSRKTTNPS